MFTRVGVIFILSPHKVVITVVHKVDLFSAGILSLPLITRMEEAPFLPIMILAIRLLPEEHGVLRLPTSYKIWEIVDIGLDIWMVRGEDILAVIRFFCPQWETEVRIM